jgi:hypothetical protein
MLSLASATVLFTAGIILPSFAESTTKAQALMNKYQQQQAASQAEVASIKALVKSYFPDEGGSYIFGTAQVAIDRHNSLVFRKAFAEEDGGKSTAEKTENQKTKASDVRDFPVVLCAYTLRNQINGVIQNYAKRYGFPMSTYQKDWPGIREQAKELILDMEHAMARNEYLRTTETNDAGEFELKEVKRGSYCMFGYLITNDKAMYWLEDIDSDGLAPMRFDFLRDNAIFLWEKNKAAPAASATRMGAAAKSQTTEPR